MKIYIPNISEQKIGGGFTWLRNFKEGCREKDVKFVKKWQEADIVLIMSVTTIDKTEIKDAVKAGKKLVMRVDNIPKKSKNKRQDPAARITEFGKLADLVVYQSYFAKYYAGWLIDKPKNEVVIYNGVDKDLFCMPKEQTINNKFLFDHHSRDECKRYHEAFFTFHMYWRKHQNAELTIIGKFSPEMIENDFDFFAGEKINWIGMVQDEYAMAGVLKQHKYLLFPSFGEACPNI